VRRQCGAQDTADGGPALFCAREMGARRPFQTICPGCFGPRISAEPGDLPGERAGDFVAAVWDKKFTGLRLLEKRGQGRLLAQAGQNDSWQGPLRRPESCSGGGDFIFHRRRFVENHTGMFWLGEIVPVMRDVCGRSLFKGISKARGRSAQSGVRLA